MKILEMILILVWVPALLLLSACGDSDSTHVASWSDAAQLSDDTVSSRYPQMAADGDGNIIAVWAESTGFYTNRYKALSGWGTPQQLGDTGITWSNLKMAVSRNGHAIVAWVQLDDMNVESTHSVRYVPGAGWGAEEVIYEIKVISDLAIDDTGNAFITSDQDYIGEPVRGISIARSNQGLGWSYARIEYFDNSTGSSYPRVAMDGSGNGFLIWVEGYDNGCQVYGSIISQASVGAPQQIASMPGSSAAWTNVAVGNSGDAMVLWGQLDSTLVSHTYACRFTKADGWGVAERIDDSQFDTYEQFLAVAPSGNFHAVWRQRTGAISSHIYYSRYTPFSGWQPPQQIGTGGVACYPQIAADDSGNLFSTWLQYDLNDPFSADAKVYANHFREGSGWGTQQQLKNALGGADEPVLVVNQPGRAMVMWSQSTGYVSGSSEIKYGIFSSRFE